MSDAFDVVVVGGGLAAVRTAQALRQRQFAGRIALFSEEPDWPYDRPPLTKNFLLGKVGQSPLQLLDAPAARELDLEVRLACRAERLMPAERLLGLAGGQTVGYGHLVVATGARPRSLAPFSGCANAHVIRTQADAALLRAQLVPGARVVVLGAGFIGLEVASTALRLGCQVALVEPASVPLAPVLGESLGAVLQAWHQRHGVVFHCGMRVVATDIQRERLQRLELQDGTILPVDVVVVAAGQQPNVDWLAGSGLRLEQGLAVDDWGRSTDAHVFGVGDATSRRVADRWRPTRHWTAVTEQAARVAQVIGGHADGSCWVDDHYFWSDQHGAKLQFVGEVTPGARLEWVVGSADAERFVVKMLDGATVTAVFGLGSPRDFMLATAQLSLAK